MSQPPTVSPLSYDGIVWRAMVNQWLWTAGYSLTSGGFLLYFAKELGANAFWIAVLLILPEATGISGLFARWILRTLGSRKRIFIVGSLIARVALLGIPLFVGFQAELGKTQALESLVICLVVVHSIQAVAYLAYLSWLSDLVPADHWGRFFGIRNVSKLLALLIVPVTGGFLRDSWRRWSDPSDRLIAYEIAFFVGWALMTLSLWPLLRLPDREYKVPERCDSEWKMFRLAWQNRSLRFLCLHNWWLAFANGLTQSVFFSYLFGPLKVGLGLYYGLSCVMRAAKLPVSLYAGKACDAHGSKTPLMVGIFFASGGLVFWLLVSPDEWAWLFAAYASWGMFAAANIAGRNLLLKLSPRSDNATQFALFRQVGGVCAGVSGLLGGYWLESIQLSEQFWEATGLPLNDYQLIILVSLVARWMSLMWLIPVHEPSPEESQSGSSSSS